MEQKDVVIIGGGPAGLAAAVELNKQGIRNMIILEREAMLGVGMANSSILSDALIVTRKFHLFKWENCVILQNVSVGLWRRLCRTFLQHHVRPNLPTLPMRA